MDLDKAMIVAGFGCRRGATEAEARAAYDAAGVTATALATADRKVDEPGLRALAHTLGLPLLGVSVEAMQAAPAVTVSLASLREAGVPSVAECSALAAAGPDARLIVPRLAVGPVTCAIAQSGDQTP
ncbi:MAG: cobalamin biosynthesis protein [Rhodospirillaceae bacterium]